MSVSIVILLTLVRTAHIVDLENREIHNILLLDTEKHKTDKSEKTLDNINYVFA